MYGGFVKWEMGAKEDGSDSIAIQVKPETHWSDMQILVCVVSSKQKETSSTSGMRDSVKTSELLKERVLNVPQTMEKMEKAINEKNFELFAYLTMTDSDNFHAVCKDTKPSIVYLNDVSWKIIGLVHAFNQVSGKLRVTYTFDAGPNAVIILLKKDVHEFSAALQHYFPTKTFADVDFSDVNLSKLIENFGTVTFPEGLQYVLHTTLGEGPKVQKEHLF